MFRAAGIVLAAAVAAPHGPPHLRIVAGTPQSAVAYAEGNSRNYVAEFGPLEVAVGNVKNVAVRFTCVTRGCTFAPSDQPDTVTRVDPATYDVRAVNGKAEISLTLSGPSPGPYTVLAYPNTARRHAGAVAFTLTAR